MSGPGPAPILSTALALGNIVPGTIILDENGYAISRIMGEARQNDIRSAVDWLLGQRKGPAPALMLRRY